MTQETNFEKVVKAGFIGAKLGTPVEVTYDKLTGRVFSKMQALPDDITFTPDVNIARVKAAASAIAEVSRADLKVDSNLSLGMLILFYIPREDKPKLDSASPKEVLDKAKELLENPERSGEVRQR